MQIGSPEHEENLCLKGIKKSQWWERMVRKKLLRPLRKMLKKIVMCMRIWSSSITQKQNSKASNGRVQNLQNWRQYSYQNHIKGMSWHEFITPQQCTMYSTFKFETFTVENLSRKRRPNIWQENWEDVQSNVATLLKGVWANYF